MMSNREVDKSTTKVVKFGVIVGIQYNCLGNFHESTGGKATVTTTFRSRINTEALTSYRWKCQLTWVDLNTRAGLSKGWLNSLVKKPNPGAKISTIDAIANAIAKRLEELGEDVPPDLWQQLVEVEITQAKNGGVTVDA